MIVRLFLFLRFYLGRSYFGQDAENTVLWVGPRALAGPEGGARGVNFNCLRWSHYTVVRTFKLGHTQGPDPFKLNMTVKVD